jgi:hypothetical protein
MLRIAPVNVSTNDLVTDFARAIKLIDSLKPVAISSRTGAAYQPGIGPHTEAQTVRLVMARLAADDSAKYGSAMLGVPYADGTRQSCDVCLGHPPAWDQAIEVKMLRLMGDNGKLNDNMMMHILSPYPAHRSALTDCSKVVTSQLARNKAVMIYGYDYPDWPMDPVIDAFEALAARDVTLSSRSVACFDSLIHPVHQRGRVFGWEVRSHDHVNG